jgi:hypothetical protein
MSNQRSVGKFCSIVVPTLAGSSHSIASLVGTTLDEGAEAYCVAEGCSYRYTGNTITADGFFFVAASGGGTWIRQVGADTVPFATSVSMTVSGQGIGFSTPAQSVWTAMPSGAFAYTESLNGFYWTLNTTTGVRTYTGASREFLLSTSITVIASGGSDLFELDLTENGSRLGATTNGSIISQISNLTAALSTNVTQTCSFFATNGSTYQSIWRITSAGPNPLAYQRFTSTFTAV